MSKYLHAFDLSMSCTGVVIFNLDTLEPIEITSFKSKQKDEHGVKLHKMREQWKELIEKYPPTEVAIERGFSRMNNSTQVIYRVHGVCNELYHEYEQFYYPPTTVKATIKNGKAKKSELQDEIKKRYPELEFKNEDESDAFAVAITHLVKTKKIKWKN